MLKGKLKMEREMPVFLPFSGEEFIVVASIAQQLLRLFLLLLFMSLLVAPIWPFHVLERMSSEIIVDCSVKIML